MMGYTHDHNVGGTTFRATGVSTHLQYGHDLKVSEIPQDEDDARRLHDEIHEQEVKMGKRRRPQGDPWSKGNTTSPVKVKAARRTYDRKDMLTALQDVVTLKRRKTVAELRAERGVQHVRLRYTVDLEVPIDYADVFTTAYAADVRDEWTLPEALEDAISVEFVDTALSKVDRIRVVRKYRTDVEFLAAEE